MTQATLEKTEAKTVTPPPKRARSRWLALGEFCLFLIVGLLLLEPILKLGGVVDEENYTIDRKVGWTPVPNRSATYRNEGYSRYTINSLGMRDVERSIAKPPNTYRIAVLGCSVTEGKQVSLDETYCRILEKQLNQAGGPIKYEVLNFAVSAYTLGQEYLRLKHFAMQFKPDLVIFTVRPNALLYMGPDLRNGFFSARPVFGVMPDGTLVEDHHFQNHWLESAEGKRVQSTAWLSTHSHLYALVGKSAYNLAEYKKGFGQPKRHRKSIAGFERFKGDLEDDVQLKRTMNTALDYLGKVAHAIVREAKSICQKENAKFVLVYLPATVKYRYGLEEEIIESLCKQLQVDYVDCNPDFDRIEKSSKKKLYIEVHPSKFGHEKMAALLYSYLERSGLLKAAGQAEDTKNVN